MKPENPVVIPGPVLLEASSLLEVGGQLLRLLRLDVELATSRAVRCLLRLAFGLAGTGEVVSLFLLPQRSGPLLSLCRPVWLRNDRPDLRRHCANAELPSFYGPPNRTRQDVNNTFWAARPSTKHRLAALN